MRKIIRVCSVVILFLIVFLSAFKAFANDGFIIEGTTLVKYAGNEENVVIPEGITSIGDAAFRDTDIVSVVIPDFVTYIGEYAFQRCSKLESVILPDGIEGIRSGSFASCPMLKAVILPPSVNYIGDGAFSGHSDLTIHIPASVKSIGDFAFWGRDNVLTIVGEIGSTAEGYAAKWGPKFEATNRTDDFYARPSSETFIIDGKIIPFEAYMINNSNYIRLCDIAVSVSGTGSEFNITAGEKRFYLKTDEHYIPVGGEMSEGDGLTKIPVLIRILVTVDNTHVGLRCYEIEGEYFFKLRDVAEVFEIEIEWDEATKAVNMKCKGDAEASPLYL